MAWIKKRVGPTLGTGSAATAYTSPSGTFLGQTRSARLISIWFCNTAGAPGVIGASIGAFGAGTQIVAAGKAIAPLGDDVYDAEAALEAGALVAVNCSVAVTWMLVVEEYILGT